jgi:hypothetical protein
MLILIGVSALVGAWLGLRYKVFALVPASLAVFASAAAVGLADGVSMWSVFTTDVFALTTLQFSYFVSASVRVEVVDVGSIKPAQQSGHS